MSGLVKAFDCQPEVFQGLPCQRLSLACGDSLLIAAQGAQVLSWVSRGRERLFLSPDNRWDGKTAIRGGVPVCFPQFNQRGSLPRHGFARNMAWQPGVAMATTTSERGLTLRSPGRTSFFPTEVSENKASRHEDFPSLPASTGSSGMAMFPWRNLPPQGSM